MNLGQILGLILIASGVILTISIIFNAETSNYTELSTFFSAYAGICFSTGAITLLKTRERPSPSKTNLGRIRVFSEKD